MVPRGGSTSSQILKSLNDGKAGMSYPATASAMLSTASRCDKYSRISFAALVALEKFQIPQKYGRCGTMRPFGPRGLENVQQSAATCGASRLATAQADGGFQIRALLPAISTRLLDASSYWTVSAGMN